MASMIFDPSVFLRLRVSRIVLALLVLAALAACSTPSPQRPDSPAVDDPLALAEAGRHAAAAEAWQARAAAATGIDQRLARLAAAEQWLAAGETDPARSLLAALNGDGLPLEAGWRLDLARAELALLEQDYSRAGRLLAVPREQVPPTLGAHFDRLRERFERSNPDSPAARISALSEAAAEPDFEPETALALLVELPLATLRELVRMHADDPMLVPWLDLALSARARLGDPEHRRAALEQWAERHALPADLAAELDGWLVAWISDLPWPDSVAVLLPGEGPLAAAGQALRNGVLGGWMDLPEASRPTLRFHWLDDSPDAAVGAWFEARAGGAEFIIGPLRRSGVDALLGLPDPGVPMLLLNRPQTDSLRPRPSAPVAMLGLPPEEEAELAAVRALVELHGRALIVAQQGDWGERVAERFASTFELGGGRIVGQARYQPQTFDHTDELAQLFRVDRSEQRIAALADVLGEELEAEPQRRTDFDVVFLVARGSDAQQLMPQLKFLGLGGKPVFATSDAWPGGNVGSDLDGIELPAAPWLLADGPAAERRERAERLFQALQGQPTLSSLHALGRDALALVPWMSLMKRDPELYLAGDVGRLRLADGVAYERDLPWARIEGGVLRRVLDPSVPDPAGAQAR